MANKPKNPSAFPSNEKIYNDNYEVSFEPGMTMLDYFAAKAMQAIIHRFGVSSYKGIAKQAYIEAQAMLTEREKHL